jgi:dTDP-4-dehydrorhamnose reductase
MTILVTGAKGQVGRELINKGMLSGRKMVGIDLQEVDITDAIAVNRFLGSMDLEIVVNAAAFTAVDAAETEIEAAFAVNRDGAANLADICAEKKIPLIHISTDYVYDGMKKGAYLESDEVSPQGVYARSKAQGDAAVADKLIEHIILRTAWVYSVHGNNFVKTMLRLFRDKPSVSVVDDQYGSPTHASDIADAILCIVDHIQRNKETEWGVYHYTGQGKTNWYGFAKKVYELATPLEPFSLKELKPIPSSAYPTPARRPANSVLDCTKIQEMFGITPAPWEESLRCMLDRLYE